MPRAGSSASEASAVFHQSETNYSANESFETINTIQRYICLFQEGCRDLARGVRVTIFIHIWYYASSLM